MNDIDLKSLASKNGIKISEEKIGLLEKFIRLFTEKNNIINLTKINSGKEFLIKHILDSLFVDKLVKIRPSQKVADIGTGGGLPGLPMAIMNPESYFTLIDSVQKKIKCVNEFASQLNLKNTTGLSGRLEDIGRDKKYRENFDIVLARALASLPVLLELAIPLIKKGGVFVAMKGPKYEDELKSALNAEKFLKMSAPEIIKYDLPDEMGTRFLLIYRKENQTPNMYPRRTGVPEKSPL